MDTATKLKLKPILLRGKLGQFVSEDEQAFARQCWREWPKEYSTLQTEEVIPEAEKQTTRPRPHKNSNATQPRHNSAQANKSRPAQKRRNGPQRGGRS